ncbi:hypothetical protein MOZ60_10735, partial [Stecheria sp. CLA-KB-P133]|nr:hypothetical protein [Stecheria sp. CLA-KB-P133]
IIERRLFVNFRWPWRSGITPNLTPENWPWFHRKPGFAISVYSIFLEVKINMPFEVEIMAAFS